MKILFIADPPDRLKPKGDSTLELLRVALAKKHECYWAREIDVEYFENKVIVHSKKVVDCKEEETAQLAEQSFQSMKHFKAVFIRKDPPFDPSYVRLCWLLKLASKETYFFNHPDVLLRFHEKLVPLEALAQGYFAKSDIIPTYIGNLAGATAFINQFKTDSFVTKPFLGFGGSDVQKFSKNELLNSYSGIKESTQKEIIIQPYIPEVLEGDRRVFLLNGKVVGHFMRIPKAGDFISNLAQGGTAASKPLSKKEVAVLSKVGKFLSKNKIDFAGIDLIGAKVSEINITSPTGMLAIKKLEGIHIAEKVIDFIKKKTT